ncbi:MAG: hypothetical protein AAGB93_03650 [Planctomycetota bacterium]
MTATLAARLTLVVLVGFAPPPTHAAPNQDLPLVREGEHFRLHCHFDSERAADEALASIEALFPAVVELYGPEERELRDVHLYRDAESFGAADERLTGGTFAENLAFAHFDTRSAHVALQPELGDAALERFGLPQITRELLAHEAAHVLRYDSFPNFRGHPRWFVDGAADWLDERALEALGVDTRSAVDPEASTTVRRLQEMEERPTAKEALSTALEDLPFYEGYAARELWFRFLMEEEPKRTRAVIAEIRRQGGTDRESFTGQTFQRVKKEFGSRLKALDKRFKKWLEAQEPAWQQVYRSLERREEDGEAVWVQMAFDSVNAIAWRTEPAEKKRYAIRGELEIVPGPMQQMNLLLGRGDRGFVSVAFVAGFGITVFDYVSENNAWNQLASVEVAGVRTGEPFAFEARVKGRALTIRIGDEDVVTIDDTKHDLRGPWGLGAQTRSVGAWRKLDAPGLD